MKRAFIVATAFVAQFPLTYVCGAFIAQEWNPAEWPEAGRALFVLGGAGCGIVCGVLAAWLNDNPPPLGR